MYEKIILSCICYIFSFSSFSQSTRAEIWADSIMENLSQEDRISQLLMVSAYSNKGKSHTSKIESLIKNYKIGGLMFLQGGPVRQANLTNRYQSISETPLMIALDAEWGISMRLDSASTFGIAGSNSIARRIAKVFLIGNAMNRCPMNGSE